MDRFAIINASVITGGEVLENHNVVVENGVFTEIRPGDCPDMHIVDAKGSFMVPGFIDMHIHGAMGYLCDDTTESLETLSSILTRFGVTGFFAGVLPVDDDISKLKELSQAQSPGAAILGFFLEGHYLKLTGAIQKLNTDYTPEKVLAMQDAAAPYKLMFAVSPEIDELETLLPLMTKNGLPAFITHTAATAEQTEKAILLGASHATHFYNVFPCPDVTEPGRRPCGTVDAIYASKQTTVDFILDGVHVEPMAVKMALTCKGPNGVCLITDANLVAGLPPGVYSGFNAVDVEISYEGAPARRVSDGLLAGSGLTLDLAVRNAVSMLGISLAEAVRLVTENPARVLGLDGCKGSIKAGYDADFSIMDENMKITRCFVKGKEIVLPE